MNGFTFAGSALGYIAAGAGVGWFVGGGIGAAVGAIVGFGLLIYQVVRWSASGDDNQDDNDHTDAS